MAIGEEEAEHIHIENLSAVSPVESLNIRILRWLTWLDKFQSNAMFFSPARQCDRDEFRAVIHA